MLWLGRAQLKDLGGAESLGLEFLTAQGEVTAAVTGTIPVNGNI